MMTVVTEISMLSEPQESPYHSPEVLTWVEAAQGGDPVAFTHLMNRFARDVYGKAFSILQNHQNTDDVVQETFIRVYRALPNFRFESSFRTWLLTIATRQALNYREQLQRHFGRNPESLDVEEGSQAIPNTEDSPLKTLLDEEARALLREALPRLPKRQREALMLKLQRDWKYERIAQEMNTSVGSVKAHIFHAIQNLTRHLKRTIR